MSRKIKPIRSHELAELFKVSHRTVESWRRRKVGPIPFSLPGVRGVWYDEADALACFKLYQSSSIRQVKSWKK